MSEPIAVVVRDRVLYDPISDGEPENGAHAWGGGYHTAWLQPPAEPLPLEEIPLLVFSEIMRDVDLFVGVMTPTGWMAIANDVTRITGLVIPLIRFLRQARRASRCWNGLSPI